MASADELFLQALGNLGKAGQEYGIKNQMDQINDRAKEIESTMKDEVEKRNALRQLAIFGSNSVSGSGGSAQQLAAIKNLMPEIPATVQQAYLQGALNGDTQMVQVAQKMMKEDEDRQIATFQRKAALELQLAEGKEMASMKKESVKAGRQEFDKLNELATTNKELQGDLRSAESAINNATFGTGWVTGVGGKLIKSNNYKQIEQVFNKINTAIKLKYIAMAGSVKIGDSEKEAEMLNSTGLDPTAGTDENRRRIKVMMDMLTSHNKQIMDKQGTIQSMGYTLPYQTPAFRPEAAGVTVKGRGEASPTGNAMVNQKRR